MVSVPLFSTHRRVLTVAVLATALAACATQAEAPGRAAPAPSTPRFWTSFETGEPQVGEGPAERAEDASLDVRAGDGPETAYTARPRVGFTGVHALGYSGKTTASAGGRADTKLFDVSIPVTAATELSYQVFPQFEEADQRYPATYVAIDLHFTDGTRLSDLGARDQHGFVLSPRGQGDSKSLYTQQWNHLQSRIGEVAAGKTIDQILVGYQSPFGPSAFRGWIDDISIFDGSIAHVARSAPSKRPSDHVLTTRGTNSSGDFSRGNNIPATAMPHGFNFWAPVTDAGSLSWFYEYARRNDENNRPKLEALALSHETSPWMGDRQTFQVMPSLASGVPSANRAERAVAFRHENEIARAHYYQVKLDNGIVAEIAPTDHAAMFRFTFPGDDASLIFDNVTDQGGLTLSPQSGELTGYTDTRSGLSNGAARMFVYAKFDRPVTAGGKLVATDGPKGGKRSKVAGYFRFEAGPQRSVGMRIATSLISVEQARRNLELEIADQDGFDDVRERAQRAWDEKLGVIEVDGATPDQLTTLYSNLYRLFLYPNSAHENTGSNAAPVWRHAVQSSASKDIPPGTTETKTGAAIAAGKVYVNNGFWDTYRTVWAAQSLLAPRQAAEMVDGFLQHYRDGGWVPRWSSPGYANLMTGTSSDASFADAYVKGVAGIDAAALYRATIRNAAVVPPNDNVGRKGMEVAPFIGYTPSSVGEGVSWALEGYINDYGIANMLAAMAKDPAPPVARERLEAESAYYRNRALNYVRMFDPAIGFFQGRALDGKWKSPARDYNPEVWGHEHDYTETNGWGFAFLAPHDGQGLANLYGGRDALARKLDAYFATPETAGHPGSYGGVIHEMVEARDIRMGQWGFSNQVAHHVPWMYLYTGQPWRTQEIVREVLARMYIGSEIGQGYPGDEDNGESSAWWLFAALGFYPLQMGSENLVIGSPLFTRATVRLDNGKKLVISAPDNSRENIYVAGLTVNGKAWDRTFIPHRLLAQGGEVEFRMSAKPGTWGRDAAALPPSLTAGDAPAAPLADLTGPGRGIASSSVPGVKAGALFDDTSGTESVFSAKSPVSVVYVFDKKPAEAVSFYTLTSGNSSGHPTAWTLEGSDDGKDWKTLDRRNGETFEWTRYTRPFRLASPASYRQYRLVVSAASDPTRFSLAEIELLGAPMSAQADKTPRISDATTMEQAGMADIRSLVPDMSQSIAYAGSDNFVGAPVDGYEAPRCWLKREAAEALARVDAALRERHMRLRVFDCYRPARAVAHFVRWAADLDDQRTKAAHYPDLDKSKLLGEYIAPVSGHSRGGTVDLTVLKCDARGANCKPLDMGTDFDYFGTRANTDSAEVSAEQRANRQLLLKAMDAQGFSNYPMEWWHYSFRFQPPLETLYDVPLR
ncbi:GH92 family glycosyl hydrolase [Pseudoxanthomonas helianthi]|uniref:D-alanyl-D-alanine dipeptidase n=1 Tax=Pseudoxanthomonas helianthi TaxID=1453541 RepID=A0A941AUS5_9GAMM|nr:GH92 family glycosyl hydrolase [Pseudoxanthomonas helianthi]